MIILMQCNTNYTASPDNLKFINLKVLESYKKYFPKVILGLSDHTHGHSTVLGSVALGARVIEKHFTDNNNKVGPDHKFSMNPKTWRQMIDSTRELEYAMGDGNKKVERNEKNTIILQRRSIRLKKNLKKEQKINKDDLIFLRPCPKDSYPIYKFKNIIGKKIKRNIKSGDYIKKSDI